MSRYHQDNAGALAGYSIGVRGSGSRGLALTWSDAEGSGTNRRTFCGFLDPDPCLLESSDVRTRARTITLGYFLPVGSALQWTAAVVPEVSWAYVQSREVGRQTHQRLEFEKGFPQLGLGFELSSSPLLLDRVRFRFSGHAAVTRKQNENCVDCLRPLFSGADHVSALMAGLSFSF